MKIKRKEIEGMIKGLTELLQYTEATPEPYDPDEWKIIKAKEKSYFPDPYENMIKSHIPVIDAEIGFFESRSKSTIDCAQQFIELSNWAEFYHEPGKRRDWTIENYEGRMRIIEHSFEKSPIRFSSEQKAKQCLAYFGEEYWKKFLNV
ncbi:MAG: hypothetical protein WD512_16830 [Candidatus Paceibacterota bacterium]